MSTDRIIVVGSTGYIGAQLMAAPLASGIEVVGLSSRVGGGGFAPLDLLHPESFEYAALTPRDAIIVCAAISSPDRCTREHAYCEAVNVTGTSAFIAAAAERGTKVVFLSSDTVIGPSDHPVSEDEPCHPVGDYGRMKHAVEERFAGNALVKIARLSYVLSRHDKFSGYLESCANAGTKAEVFHPFNRRAVYAGDVVAGLLALAQDEAVETPQTVNFAGPALVSRRDIADAYKELAWPELAYDIVEPGDDFFVHRPRTIDMACTRLAALLGRAPLSIREAIGREMQTEPGKGVTPTRS